MGNDGGIEGKIQHLQEVLCETLISVARNECDRYVRESPRFYDEGTFSIYQFRQILQQTSQSYGADSIIKAEPAIRQLLKLDFEPKVSATIRRDFRQKVNQTLKTQILPMAKQQADDILQQYNRARFYLEQTLEQEAEEKIARNRRGLDEIEAKIAEYNDAVSEINSCFQFMQLYDKQLPIIADTEFATSSPDEIEDEEESET